MPTWVRLGWAAVLCVVGVWHVGHAVAMRGERRRWHAGHTVMAAGMASMYLLPRMSHPGWYPAGLAVFALAAAVVVALTLGYRRRDGVLNPLWVASAADMVVMVYMFLPPSSRTPVLTYLFVAYLAGQAAAWALGLWTRVPVLRRSAAVVTEARPGGAVAVDAGRSPAGEVEGRIVGLTAHSSRTVLASLAVMAAGTAYMLLAM